MSDSPTAFAYEPATLDDLSEVAKRSRFSNVPELDQKDISDIWWHASQFIGGQIGKKKGVAVTGLGIFSLQATGPNSYSPAFVLGRDFIQRHGIRAKNQANIATSVPVVPMNYAHVATESGFKRNSVENCITEIINAIRSCIEEERPIALTFPGVGRLSIKNRKVKFGFFREFLNDPKALDWRPPTRALGTARPVTVGAFGPRGSSRMESRNGDRSETPRLLCTPSYGRERSGLGATNPVEAWRESQASSGNTPSLPSLNPSSLRRPTTAPAPANDLELTKKLLVRNLHTTAVAPANPMLASDGDRTRMIERGAGPEELMEEVARLQLKRERIMLPPAALKNHQKNEDGICPCCVKRSTAELNPILKETAKLYELRETQSVLKRSQEEARRAKELEQMLARAKIEMERDNAMYNIQAARERPRTAQQDSESKMDVFCFRPATSHSAIRRVRHGIAQEHLQAAAQKSFTKYLKKKQSKEVEESEIQQETDLVKKKTKESMEDRRNKQRQYLEDLKQQAEHKKFVEQEGEKMEPVEWSTTSPTINTTQGLNSTGKKTALGPESFTDDNEREQLRRAKLKADIEEQKQTERERRRKAEAEKKRELDEGRLMLKKARETLINEMAETGKQNLATRAKLEEEWRQAAELKKKREEDERKHRAAPAPKTILEQAKEVDRCGRCQRDTKKAGKSNVVAGKFMSEPIA